jgi:hypothetical protein
LFREITGVKFETYLKIVSDYRNYKLSTIKTGRPLRVPIEDRVLILLLYFKQYEVEVVILPSTLRVDYFHMVRWEA